MEPHRIHAILFDLGGTLEEVWFDEPLQRQALPGFRSLLERWIPLKTISDEELNTRIQKGMSQYKPWRETHMREMSPEELYRTFILAGIEIPSGIPEMFWEEVAFYYESRFFRRELRPETPLVLEELKKRKMKLGVISNIVSRTLVPFRLRTCGIDRFFDVVLTSARLGIRKPNPAIFLKAIELLRVEPKQAIYIGDTLSRDVAGARKAGYGKAIQIRSFFTSLSDTSNEREAPDLVVQNLTDLLKIVPLNGESL